MAVGKLKNYYFKRRQGHYDFKIHMMTTTSVKKNTTLAIFLYANSKFRYFFFRSCKVSFYCTDFGSLASDSFPQSSRSLRSALEAEVRRLDSLSVCALRKSMFRTPLSNERGALVYFCTQGPCASNTRKNRICNILLPRRRSISCFNFFFQIISLPYVVAYDHCRLKKIVMWKLMYRKN